MAARRSARPASVQALEDFGRHRLSKSFFMRDFLFSEIAAIHGLPTLPDDPNLAIKVGERLCTDLLEPLQDAFGRIAIRSAYRSVEVNDYGNRHGHRCAANESNYAGHIWDRLDADGHAGATACIVVPNVWDRFGADGEWQRLAWWVHDHLPYSNMEFFGTFWAFNLTWSEAPKRRITSYVAPKGTLTKPGMANHHGSHEEWWRPLFLMSA